MRTKRRALIVGIDHYQQQGMDLKSAVADARGMASMLGSHQDHTANYDCRLWADQTDYEGPITRAALRKAMQQLFTDFHGDVLFYFSGHGSISATGGWLVTHDGSPNDWGISMGELLQLALYSQANDILLILDCCHAGDLANWALQNREAGTRTAAVLREDMTVIAASMPREVAIETGEHGFFTAAVLSALEGGAADAMGWVTAPSIYAYVERRFWGWPQQPVYKSHATQVTVVRQCAPLIDRRKLGRLIEIFPTPDSLFRLSPAFEPGDGHGKVRKPVNSEKVELAGLFKEYRDAGLLKPSVSGEQLYRTALRSHTVELTPHGQEYWWLVKQGKI
jgi:hypothetical protein